MDREGPKKKNPVFLHRRELPWNLRDKLFSSGNTANNKAPWKNIFG